APARPPGKRAGRTWRIAGHEEPTAAPSRALTRLRGHGEAGSAGGHGLVRFQEGPDVLDDLADRVLGLLPWIDRGLGIGREAHDLHRDRERMRRDVVREDQDWRPAGFHEIAGHREDEI